MVAACLVDLLLADRDQGMEARLDISMDSLRLERNRGLRLLRAVSGIPRRCHHQPQIHRLDYLLQHFCKSTGSSIRIAALFPLLCFRVLHPRTDSLPEENLHQDLTGAVMWLNVSNSYSHNRRH